VSKTPEEEQAGDQYKWDHKSLINKPLAVPCFGIPLCHFVIGLVNTRLPGFMTFPISLPEILYITLFVLPLNHL
jgi:hypothetical protein